MKPYFCAVCECVRLKGVYYCACVCVCGCIPDSSRVESSGPFTEVISTLFTDNTKVGQYIVQLRVAMRSSIR